MATQTTTSATAVIRKRVGFIIAVQLVLAVAILGAAIWSAINLRRTVEEKEKAEASIQKSVEAERSAVETAKSLGAAANDYVAQIRVAMQSVSKGQDAALQKDPQSREQALLELQRARTALLALKESDLAKLLRTRPEGAIELSEDGDLLALEIQRNIARAYYMFGNPPKAWEEMTTVIGTGLGAGKSSPHIAPAEDVAGDYILRATFTCRHTQNDGNGQDDATVLGDLEKAPDDVRALLSLASLKNSKALGESCPGVMALINAKLAAGETREPQGVQDAAAFRITELYLHIENRADREAARRVREQLRNTAPGEKIYKVLGIEDVDPAPNNRSIRYYYSAQKAQAEDELRPDLLKAISDAITQTNADTTMTAAEKAAVLATLEKWNAPFPRVTSLEGMYQRLPPHRAEIWF